MIQTFPSAIPITNPRPIWTEFAETIIGRLCEHHGKPDIASALQESGWHTHSLTSEELSRCPGFDDLPIDDIDDTIDNCGPTLAPVPPAVKLPLRELMSAIRLAATFKSEAAFLNSLYRRSITLLDSFPPADLASVIFILNHGLAPADWRLASCALDKDELNAAILLRPELSDGDVGPHGTKIFLKKLDEALESEAGILVLCPHGTAIPKLWRDGLPKPLSLAPLSQVILVELLRHSHPACDLDEPAIRHSLPSDQTLATLAYPSLRLAMRESSALAAVRRLSELTEPGPDVGLRLKDLAGFGPAKDIALGIIDDLAAWAQGDLPWEHVSRGLLLVGAPGVGKTELARAMARESGLTFVSGSYASWQQAGHLGDFLKSMNNSFATAMAGVPSVLFVDELDAFSSRSRDQNTQNASYNSKCVAGFLELLDGVAGREGVVVIAATNHFEHIDPAIIRSGRFDKHVRIALPSRDDLAVILRQHLRTDLPHADLDRLAALAIGRSGADIAAAVRSARGRARQNRRGFDEADLATELCPAPSVKTPELDWRASVHEAGHAIVIAALGVGTPICLRLDNSGGECITQMTVAAMTAADFHRERMADIGGRAAENLVLGTISSGAGGPMDSDLAKVSRSALREEVSYGLGALGSLWLSQDLQPMDILRLPPPVQQRLRQCIADAEHDAGEVLRMNRAVLEDLATALNLTRLVEGPVLQCFLSRVISWRGDEPKIDMSVTKDQHMTSPVDLEREDICAAEKVLPHEC